MNKASKTNYITVFSIVILLIADTTGACMPAKIGGNNNRAFARTELDMLMFLIKNEIIKLETLSDKEYIDIGHKFAALVNTIGKINSKEIHYFRTYFSRAPKTLDEMTEIILDNKNNTFGWGLLSWQSMAFHMYGKDSEYNLKFISTDGHFEAVYNKDGILLTQENDPLNMGTFNYAHQLADKMAHYNLDVWPYFMWNNTEEAMNICITEKPESVPIDKNKDAMERYRKYKALLK